MLKRIFKNKYGEIRGGWPVASSVIALFAVQFILTFLCQLAALAVIMGQGKSFSVFEEFVLRPGFTSAMLLINNLVSIFVLIALFKLFYKRPIAQIGLAKAGIGQLWVGCVFGIAAISLAFILLLISGHAKVWAVDYTMLYSPKMLFSLVLFILVGFSEEIMGRGFIMTALKTTRNRVVIFTASALIFSLLHALNPNVTVFSLLNIFLVGILFAYMFVKSGALWLPIGFHITWNFFQGNIFGINVSGIETESLLQTQLLGADWISGGAFGAEGGVIVTLVTLLSFIYVHFFVHTPQDPVWTMQNHLPLVRGTVALAAEDEQAAAEAEPLATVEEDGQTSGEKDDEPCD